MPESPLIRSCRHVRLEGCSIPEAELAAMVIGDVLSAADSSRRLEREAGRNLEVIWLVKRLTPDDKTYAS